MPDFTTREVVDMQFPPPADGAPTVTIGRDPAGARAVGLLLGLVEVGCTCSCDPILRGCCLHCGAELSRDESGHAPDCPWLAAKAYLDAPGAVLSDPDFRTAPAGLMRAAGARPAGREWQSFEPAG